MENVSNRLELLTTNDGHAVIFVQTTGARMRYVGRYVCAYRLSATSETTWTAGWRD